MTLPAVLFFCAFVYSTPATTAPASRTTTTTAMMTLERSGPLLRAAATARLAAVCCCFLRRALRSAPPTERTFLVSAEHPVQGKQCPRPHRQPPGQQQEPDIPCDLLRVLRVA